MKSRAAAAFWLWTFCVGSVVSSAEPPRPTAEEKALAAQLEAGGATVERDGQGRLTAVAAPKGQLDLPALGRLAAIDSLEALELGARMPREHLAAVGRCTNLVRLYLHDSTLADEALAPLAALKRLEVLTLENVRIEGGGLVHLRDLKRLEVLNLRRNPIADGSLAHLKGLAALELLVLEDTDVTGAGLAHLKPLTNLRVLNLNRCAVRNDGLKNLLGLQNLRMLHINECPLSEAKIKEFKKAMTNLAVYY